MDDILGAFSAVLNDCRAQAFARNDTMILAFPSEQRVNNSVTETV